MYLPSIRQRIVGDYHDLPVVKNALTRTPRAAWVDEGLRALAAGGPDAVRIEPLARTLGVTKGGFYWHFDGRRALLDELLDAWERYSVDEVIERIENEGGDARDKLHLLSALAEVATPGAGDHAGPDRPRHPGLGAT